MPALIKKLFWRLYNQLSLRLLRPRMVSGYCNLITNNYLTQVRVSNTTAINAPEQLNLQDDVFIGHYCFIESSQGIVIGKGSQICSHNVITTHSSHISIRLYTDEYLNHSNHVGYSKGRIIIGDYCFIGPHCTIMPGTRLGTGCLVKAYSCLRGDYPDFAIIAGNPGIVVGDVRDLDQQYLAHLAPKLVDKYRQIFK